MKNKSYSLIDCILAEMVSDYVMRTHLQIVSEMLIDYRTKDLKILKVQIRDLIDHCWRLVTEMKHGQLRMGIIIKIILGPREAGSWT